MNTLSNDFSALILSSLAILINSTYAPIESDFRRLDIMS